MDADQLRTIGLTCTTTGPIAQVNLARPDVRNAQTPEMWRTLAQLGAELLADAEVRVVVLSGEGPSFSAGLDRRMLDPSASDLGEDSLASLLAHNDDDLSAAIDAMQSGFTWLRDPRIVSVAAVRGHAIGAGFQLALACDVRVVSDTVSFCMKESALGLVPDLTGTQALVEAVGYQRALELCVTARTMGADEAVQTGVALLSVPDAELEDAVDELCAALTSPLPGAAREIKELLLHAHGRDLDTQRRFEREAQVRRFRELASPLRS